MSSVHCVVVWEYESAGQWLPHTPGVTRTLERAHAKKLTRVVLADADPALKGHYVNLRTLTQCRDTQDGGSVECLVRRQCYSVHSAAGRGARWEWARLSSPPLCADLHYEPMSMEVQCSLEEAWCGAAECVTVEGGWSVSVARGTARRGPALRLVRRAAQPPYPLTRPPAPPPAPPDRHAHTAPVRRPRIPQQHTGSSVHSVQSNMSAQSADSSQAASPAGGGGGGARSAEPRDRKPGLARQILHNLNIFSNNNKQVASPQVECERERDRDRDSKQTSEGEGEGEGQRTDTECSSTRSGRRHSVDTVSTYLSHESKDSLQRGSVGELLNCSGGSDDVFEPHQPTSLHDHLDECVDRPRALSPLVMTAVSCPQWGAVCPLCLGALGGAGCVALPCDHMLHRACLQDTEYVACLVCGREFGRGGGAGAPAPALPPAGQPPGSMAWRLHHAALPQLHASTSILVTYNFQSGVQTAGQPAPGAPYYAVGFPRHSLLPDDALGRQVLAALRTAWERRLLFTVCASQTTGREHVVAWRVAPPPACPAHYRAPHPPARLLLAALARLHALIYPHADNNQV